MTNLFFMLCWWVGVFTRPWVPASPVSPDTMSFWKVPPPVAKFEFAGRFVLFDEKGREIVVVNTRTGRVKLRGNPNAAAKRFWKAVELMGRAGRGGR
jgi:hypothetical protein